MSLGTWFASMLLATAVPDAAPPGDKTAACAPVDRNDLQPDLGPFSPQRRAESPYSAAVWADLAEADASAPVLMLVMTNFSGAPELAMSVTREPGSPDATVTVRRHLDNMWIEMQMWEGRQRKKGARPSGPEAERAFLKTASRKVETFRATIDDDAAAVVARVWSRMIARARPDGPSSVRVHDGAAIHFQNQEGWASGRARGPGSLGEQLVELGRMLATYAQTPPPKRRPLRAQLVAAADFLEAGIDRANGCDRMRQSRGLGTPGVLH